METTIESTRSLTYCTTKGEDTERFRVLGFRDLEFDFYGLI